MYIHVPSKRAIPNSKPHQCRIGNLKRQISAPPTPASLFLVRSSFSSGARWLLRLLRLLRLNRRVMHQADRLPTLSERHLNRHPFLWAVLSIGLPFRTYPTRLRLFSVACPPCGLYIIPSMPPFAVACLYTLLYTIPSIGPESTHRS